MGVIQEVPVPQVEIRRRRANTTRTLVMPMLAGLTLAACTTGKHAPETFGSTASVPSTTVTATVSQTPPPRTISPSSESAVTPSSVPSTSVAATIPGVAGCAPYFDVSKYQNHEYEVCVAYISNSAEIALQGLYKFGNNRVSILSDGAKHHFETRYWDQPRQTIEQEVASWPKMSDITGNEVEDSITLVSVSSSLAADRGLVQTQESWQVAAPDGAVLYNEPLHAKDITMCRGRLPGHPLHEWMVVATSRQPHFDCIGFDKSNGIAP